MNVNSHGGPKCLINDLSGCQLYSSWGSNVSPRVNPRDLGPAKGHLGFISLITRLVFPPNSSLVTSLLTYYLSHKGISRASASMIIDLI